MGKVLGCLSSAFDRGAKAPRGSGRELTPFSFALRLVGSYPSAPEQFLSSAFISRRVGEYTLFPDKKHATETFRCKLLILLCFSDLPY